MRGIYIIRNRYNGRYYIGSSGNIEKRWKDHREKLDSGKHCTKMLQYDWRKYGDINFSFEILQLIPYPGDLLDAEQKWIDKFYSLEKCYNTSLVVKSENHGRPRYPRNKRVTPQKLPGLLDRTESTWIVKWLKEHKNQKVKMGWMGIYRMTIEQVSNRFHVPIDEVASAARGEQRR